MHLGAPPAICPAAAGSSTPASSICTSHPYDGFRTLPLCIFLPSVDLLLLRPCFEEKKMGTLVYSGTALTSHSFPCWSLTKVRQTDTICPVLLAISASLPDGFSSWLNPLFQVPEPAARIASTPGWHFAQLGLLLGHDNGFDSPFSHGVAAVPESHAAWRTCLNMPLIPQFRGPTASTGCN